MKTRIVLGCAFLLAAADMSAQEFVSNVSKRGTSAVPFLSIAQGSRATAMGNAFVAMADDPSALYWNPAGIARLEGFQAMFDHTFWVADIDYNFVGLSYNIGDIGSVGFSITASSIDEMKVTTVASPEGTGEIFSVQDISASVAFAMNLTEDFAIGFNPKIVSQSIWKANATSIAMDLGILYRTPFEGFVLGMSVANFGPKMKMTGQSTLVLYDADPSSGGNNGRIPASLDTDEWPLPLTFRVGVAYHAPLGEMHKLALEVDALVPSDNYESVNVGAEYVFNGIIAIRGGYKSLWLPDSEESFTVGAGIIQQLVGSVTIRVDYAYQDFGRLANAQKFSLGVGF